MGKIKIPVNNSCQSINKFLSIVFNGLKINDAGSYGYLINAAISTQAFNKALHQKKSVICLQVNESLSGGLAIYEEETNNVYF
jgi:hypothetical protein